MIYKNPLKIKYLISATNLQELKKIYFNLAKQFHPDITGGNLETMQIINNEYDYLQIIFEAEKENNNSINNFKEWC